MLERVPLPQREPETKKRTGERAKKGSPLLQLVLATKVSFSKLGVGVLQMDSVVVLTPLLLPHP